MAHDGGAPFELLRVAAADKAALLALARVNGLRAVELREAVGEDVRQVPRVARAGEARMPLATGVFTAIGYHGLDDGAEHLALVLGSPGGGAGAPAAVHVECLVGHALGSWVCDCELELRRSLRRIADAGRGALVYVRRAGRGLDRLGDPLHGRPSSDERALGGEILADLGVVSHDVGTPV
jgi:3,4-dihydroxy 2-butanone 4-phosphate synthase/GTP cyclohydrolase II